MQTQTRMLKFLNHTWTTCLGVKGKCQSSFLLGGWFTSLTHRFLSKLSTATYWNYTCATLFDFGKAQCCTVLLILGIKMHCRATTYQFKKQKTNSLSSQPHVDRKSGGSFVVHKTFPELHSKTALQCSHKQQHKDGKIPQNIISSGVIQVSRSSEITNWFEKLLFTTISKPNSQVWL